MVKSTRRFNLRKKVIKILDSAVFVPPQSAVKASRRVGDNDRIFGLINFERVCR